MREILFRGKIQSGKWVEGGFHKHTKAIHCPLGAPAGNAEDTVDLILRDGMADWELPVPIEGVEVLPETVGQYTGFKDKNGKRIFEGDILNFPEFMIGEEKIEECWVQVVWGDGGWETQESGFRARDVLDADAAGYATVAGNIWDNPKLLEENK